MAQEVRNYLEILLDRFFHEDLEFVSGNIIIRREYLPVPNFEVDPGIRTSW